MLTVVFASHNGAGVLRRTLQSFTRLQCPPGGWKLVAVDNASTDETHEILSAMADKLPLTVLREHRPGKNVALNTALPTLDEGLIVFTDDDVLPAPDWLLQLARSAEEQPQHDLFGGRIEPDWPAAPPAWLQHTTNLGMLYAITPDIPCGPVAAGAIWGPNMAVRTRAICQVGGFDTAIGPDGSSDYIMGSETNYLEKLERAGFRAWFNDEAVVRHQIRSAQLDRAWVLRRYFRFGRASYAKDHVRKASDSYLFGVERWLVRMYAETHVQRLFARVRGRHAELVRAEERVQFLAGQLYQSRQAHLKARR